MKDLRYELLMDAKVEDLRRLGQFMGILMAEFEPDWDDHWDVWGYKKKLADQIARRTDSRYFKC